jgi:molybdate transport system substrate-binding protein
VDLPTTIRILSSMATRRLLADLTTQFESTSPLRLSVESVGGVDAAKRVRAGEPFDVIVLADNVIDALIAEGHIVEGSRVDLVASPVAVAVRAGTTHPDISSADAVKSAILAAASIGYSTGPSGTYLATLFDRWGVADAVKGRIRVAPPGVPVGSLVAKGELELGFQQLSEFVDLDGIDVVGLLPPEIQAITIFSGGVGRAAAQPDRAREVLEFMAGPSTVETKRRLGMEPALTL